MDVLRFSLLSLLALVALGCGVERGANPNYGCDDRCPKSRCYKGFCLGASSDGGPGDVSDGGLDGGGATGKPCEDEGASGFCYEGEADTATLGRCRAGTRTCMDGVFSACLGQVMPAEAESCNAIDDDCDGKIDEELLLGSCSTGGEGACRVGILQCVNGITPCLQLTPVALEQCDDEDNDCDGETDEEISSVCYTASTGCTIGDNSETCSGICKTGTQECIDGELTPCAGEITPEDEVCTAENELANDEDCDGVADEDCPCADGEEQECYGGPSNTAQVPPCRRGAQTCENSRFGSCEGAVLPSSETCENEGQDDDCNGTTDDVPLRNAPCAVASNKGACMFGHYDCGENGMACVTPEPDSLSESCNGGDEDCDGKVDEDFDFATDAMNCGGCGELCAGGTSCCGGGCVSLAEDESNCGECGNICGSGLTCCGGGCVDLNSNPDHCSVCGNSCPALLGIRTCRSGKCATL